MTPALLFCNQRCSWCWRDINHTLPEWQGEIDDPIKIVEDCIKEHTKYLHGFGGNKKRVEKKYQESLKPLHFAISLAGEPTLYPRLDELIRYVHSKGMTTFLVTNGTNPAALKNLISKNSEPTQLYLTLPAPDKETYIKVCNPIIKDGWEKILDSLKIVSKFKRNVLRLTLAKNINMIKPQKYGELIAKHAPLYVELKAYMWVGYSRDRNAIENMPKHEDIIIFAEEILKVAKEYKIIDEKKESRVVLLSKNDPKDRKITLS